MKVQFNVFGVSRDTLVTKEEFWDLLHGGRRPTNLAERKRGRGLGARKRRGRESRERQVQDAERKLLERKIARGLALNSFPERRTIGEWIQRHAR